MGKGQDNASCGHSGTKAPSVSELPSPWCSLTWLGIENEQEDCPQKSTMGQAWKWCIPFSSHPTAYNLVTWPHLTSREAGRMMVVCCGRKGSPLPWLESRWPSWHAMFCRSECMGGTSYPGAAPTCVALLAPNSFNFPLKVFSALPISCLIPASIMVQKLPCWNFSRMLPQSQFLQPLSDIRFYQLPVVETPSFLSSHHSFLCFFPVVLLAHLLSTVAPFPPPLKFQSSCLYSPHGKDYSQRWLHSDLCYLLRYWHLPWASHLATRLEIQMWIVLPWLLLFIFILLLLLLLPLRLSLYMPGILVSLWLKWSFSLSRTLGVGFTSFFSDDRAAFGRKNERLLVTGQEFKTRQSDSKVKTVSPYAQLPLKATRLWELCVVSALQASPSQARS